MGSLQDQRPDQFPSDEESPISRYHGSHELGKVNVIQNTGSHCGYDSDSSLGSLPTSGLGNDRGASDIEHQSASPTESMESQKIEHDRRSNSSSCTGGTPGNGTFQTSWRRYLSL